MSKLICYSVLMILGLTALAPLSSSSVIKAKQPTSHLTFDYNWPEPDSKIRQYPHERYCHYFYIRELEDTYTIRKCPKGEMFDYHSHECKDKKSAQCWSHRYGKTEEHDNIHSKLKRHFKCPFSNGRYPDVFHCEKYFVCVNGVPEHKHCAPTNLFDRIRRHCVYEGDALCADVSDADDINHRCPKPSGKFGHPKDCSKYYQCHHGKRELQMCANSTLFDEMDRHCKDKEQVQCGHRYNPHDYEKVTKEVVVATKERKLSLDTTTEQKESLERNSSETAEKTSTASVSSSKASKNEVSISPSEQVRTTNISTNEQTESSTSPKEKIIVASTKKVDKEAAVATKERKLSLDTTTEQKESLERNSSDTAEKTSTASVSSPKASKSEVSISPSEQVRTTNISTNEQTVSSTSPKEKIIVVSTNHVIEPAVKPTLSPLHVSSGGITV